MKKCYIWINVTFLCLFGPFFAKKYTFRQSVYEIGRKSFGKVHFEVVAALLLEFEGVRMVFFKDIIDVRAV